MFSSKHLIAALHYIYKQLDISCVFSSSILLFSPAWSSGSPMFFSSNRIRVYNFYQETLFSQKANIVRTVGSHRNDIKYSFVINRKKTYMKIIIKSSKVLMVVHLHSSISLYKQKCFSIFGVRKGVRFIKQKCRN